MTWPIWIWCLFAFLHGTLSVLLGVWVTRRSYEQRLAESCSRIDHGDRPCAARHCYLKYTFISGDPGACLEGIEAWTPQVYPRGDEP